MKLFHFPLIIFVQFITQPALERLNIMLPQRAFVDLRYHRNTVVVVVVEGG